VFNNCNITNSDKSLLCVTASIGPFNDPNTGWLLTAAAGHRCQNHASVSVLPALPLHPGCVRGPLTTIFTSAGDVTPPSLVVPSLGTINDVSHTTAAVTASVA